MNSFDLNFQVEDFEICDYYQEIMEIIEEELRENYKNKDYSPIREV